MLLASWKFLESYVFERVGERHGKGNEEFSDFAKKKHKVDVCETFADFLFETVIKFQ